MQNDNRRFSAIMDPTEGWTVWDSHQDCPAIMSGMLLTGLTDEKAGMLVKFLNASLRPQDERRRSA